jgi:predicted acetyltransferase
VLTYRPLNEGDLDQFIALEHYAFPTNYVSTDVAADRLARLRGVFVGETLAAQLEIIPLECSVEPDFMLRLLDVPAALEAYPFAPGTSGRLTMAVHDDWIAENDAVFALEFAAGRCQVTRLPPGAPADLRCEVGTLAQISSRYLCRRTAVAFGVLEAHRRKALDLAEQAFAGLAPFSSDFFLR